MTEISGENIISFISEEKPLVLDVRTQDEFSEGALPDAKLIPYDQLPFRFIEIEQYKDSPVLVYCASGGRSSIACSVLEKNGFKDIVHYKSGYCDWLIHHNNL